MSISAYETHEKINQIVYYGGSHKQTGTHSKETLVAKELVLVILWFNISTAKKIII